MNSAVADIILAAGLSTFLGLFAYLARHWAATLDNSISHLDAKLDATGVKVDKLTASASRRNERLDRRLTRLESWVDMHNLTHSHEDPPD